MRAGTALVVVGVILVAVGLVLRFAPWALTWFGRLPGDILIERNGTTIFIPITSMVLVSIVVSVILGVVDRLR